MDRNRHYGLLVGDKFFYSAFNSDNKEEEALYIGEIIEVASLDNNAAFAKFTNANGKGYVTKVVCEWCDLIVQNKEVCEYFLLKEMKKIETNWITLEHLEKELVGKFIGNEDNYKDKRLSVIRNDFKTFIREKVRIAII